MRRRLIALGACLTACVCTRPDGGGDGGEDGGDPCAPCADPDSGYLCQEDGGRRCEPILVYDPLCFVTCDVGQVCEGGRCACHLTRLADPGPGLDLDSCLRYGRTCDRTTLACRRPGEMEWCTPLGGCEAGFDCVPVTLRQKLDNTVFSVFRCARSCTAAADCVHPRTRCETRADPNLPGLVNHCGWNLCPRGTGGAVPYFQPCPGTTEPSTCLPYAEPAFESALYSYFAAEGFCVKNGTTPAGGNCDPKGTTARRSDLCPAGHICLPVASGGGFCTAACNWGAAASIGATCARAGATCLNATGVIFAERPPVQLGACWKNCSLLNPLADCPRNASGRAFGCQVHPAEFDVDTGKGLCVPTAAGAPAGGATCEATYLGLTDLLEWTCADRLFCTAWFAVSELIERAGGRCSPYCDFSTCPGGQPCAGSCPGGSLCVGAPASDAGPQWKVGFCLSPRSDGGTPAPDGGRSD